MNCQAAWPATPPKGPSSSPDLGHQVGVRPGDQSQGTSLRGPETEELATPAGVCADPSTPAPLCAPAFLTAHAAGAGTTPSADQAAQPQRPAPAVPSPGAHGAGDTALPPAPGWPPARASGRLPPTPCWCGDRMLTLEGCPRGRPGLPQEQPTQMSGPSTDLCAHRGPAMGADGGPWPDLCPLCLGAEGSRLQRLTGLRLSKVSGSRMQPARPAVSASVRQLAGGLPGGGSSRRAAQGCRAVCGPGRSARGRGLAGSHGVTASAAPASTASGVRAAPPAVATLPAPLPWT